MAISVLEKIKSQVRIIASDKFVKEFKAISKGLSASEYNRDELNTSLHTIEYKNIFGFIRDYSPSSTVGEIKVAAYELFTSMKALALEKGYIVLDSKIYLADKSAEKQVKDIHLAKKTNSRSTYSFSNEHYKKLAEATNFNGFNAVKTLIGRVKPIDPLLSSFLASGIDVGHVTGNVLYLAGIPIINALKKSNKLDKQSLVKLFKEDTDLSAEAKRIFLKDKIPGITSEEIQSQVFDAIFNYQISLVRHFGDGDVTGSMTLVDLTPRRLMLDIKRIVTKSMVSVAPQSAKLNQAYGREVEARIIKALPYFFSALQQYIANVAPTSQGSKSIVQLVAEEFTNQFKTGKVSKRQTLKTTTSSKKSTKETKNKIALVPDNYTVTATNRPVPKLRSAAGQFTSLVKIENLIRAQLTERVRQNMVEPALVNRTGRFASSVNLEHLTRDERTGAITAFLKYMKYPYSTFDPGGIQHSSERSPTSLITKSVREIATSLVTERLKVVVI